MPFVKHRHDQMHRGQVPADQLAEGTPDPGDVPTAQYDGSVAWEPQTGEGGAGAPTDADYLVGTASGDLSAEIVVGTTPGGELGGTWPSPTVDATHSGSSHAGIQSAAEATAAAALGAHTGDTTDAHDASAISLLDTGGHFTATDVEAALAELAAGSIDSLGWFDVRSYGAVGDDTTDDTTAIQDAIDAAVANGGGTVYFPAATYKITAALTIGTVAVRLLGDGGAAARNGGSSIIRQATANTNGVTISWPAYPCKIEGLKLEGPTGNSSGAGIYIGESPGGDIDFFDVFIEGFYNGIRLGAQSYYAKMFHVRVSDADNIACLLTAGGNNTDFFGCRFENSAIGLDIGGHISVSFYGGSIEFNDVGVRFNGGSSNGRGLLLSGVYFEHENTKTDILLGNSTQVYQVTIDACNFIKSDLDGTGWHIDADDVDGLTISNCHFTSDDVIRTTADTENVVLMNNKNVNAGTITLQADTVEIDPSQSIEPEDVGTAAAGTSRHYARADHVHGGSGNEPAPTGHYELLMVGSSPPEPLEDGTGADWLWVWVNG